MRFDELDLSDEALDALDAMRFETCTPIQQEAIPAILTGRDLLAVAQTGTGKTAAYLLPIIDQLAEGGFEEDAVNCVVMAPTRELVQQIDQQLQGFSYFMPVKSLTVYGGTDGFTYEQQRKGLKTGADIVVATPGRLLAHLSMGYVDLSRVSFFILDEADRMLDMGFYDDIMQIASHMNKNRQTLMFSATMPPKIRQLASSILDNPQEIRLSMSKPAEKIDQSAYVCYETQKIPLLMKLFSEGDFEKVIVFGSSKLKVKELARALRSKKLSVGEMHSDLDQSRREEVMLDFKAGKIKILVATDIVARGIDIDDINLVVNFDVPHECEDYVHRIGRTARADSDGMAITLVTDKDRGRFRRIEQFLEKEVRKNELPAELGDAPTYGASGSRGERRSRGGKGRGGNNRRGDRSPEGARGRGSRRNRREGLSQPESAEVQAVNAQSTQDAASGSGADEGKKRRRRNHRGGRRNKRPTATPKPQTPAEGADS